MILLGDLGVCFANGVSIDPFEGVLALRRVFVVVISCNALCGVEEVLLSEGLLAERFNGDIIAGVEGVVAKSE